MGYVPDQIEDMLATNDQCAFCWELESARERWGRVVCDEEYAAIAPTIGCFTPGYCLLIPKDHVYSIASLSDANFEKCLSLVERARSVIGSVFGDVIVAEHGMGGPKSSGVACYDHAHIHMIPMPGMIDSVVKQFRETGGNGVILKSDKDFGKYAGQDYVMLSVEKGKFEIWEDLEDFERQFVRRVCSKILGIEKKFSWMNYPFDDNMKVTAETLLGKF